MRMIPTRRRARKREERPGGGARLITKITDNPKRNTTRPVRREALLPTIGASS